MVLELRPAHDPSKSYGFASVVISVADLSASIWLWYRDGDQWAVQKVITIPAEPADSADLPPILQGSVRSPPLITDIDLSVDDRWLYVSCWAQANSNSLTSATRSTRGRRRRCSWAG